MWPLPHCRALCYSLKKECKLRPNYQQLLSHPFLSRYEEKDVDVAAFVSSILDKYGQQASDTS